MADDKKITIRAGIDASTLEKDFQALEERLKKFHQSQNRHEQNAQVIKRVAQDPNLGKYAKAAFDRTDQEHRAGIQKENEKLQKQMEISGKQAQATKSVISALESEIKTTKMSEEALKAKTKALDDLNKKLKEHDAIVLNSAKQLEAQGGIKPETANGGGAGGGGKGGGDSDAAQKQKDFNNLMKTVASMALKGAAGIAAISSTYGAFLTHRSTRDREMLGANAAIAQGTNQSFQNTMRGRGMENFFEAPERQKAMGMALKEREGRIEADPYKMIGQVGGAAIGGAVAGGIVSAGNPLAMAGGAALAAGHTIFGDKGIYNRMFDKEAYMANVNKDTVANYQANIENEKILNPNKFAALKSFGENSQNFQNLQRSFNLSDEDLIGGGITPNAKRRGGSSGSWGDQSDIEALSDEARGRGVLDKDQADRQAIADQANKDRKQGVLEEQMRDSSGASAFSKERITQNLNQILQASGTTAFAREGGGRMAAEYQRAGMTNAAGELGALAGFGGGQNATEQKYIRLLSEGMKIGINQSTMPEEMRAWTAAATQMLVQTGGAQGAVDILGTGMVGTGTQATQAARTAFEQENARAGEATGDIGAMKWAYLNSKKGSEAFAGVDADTKGWATEVDLKNLNEDDPMVQYMASQMAKGPDGQAKTAGDALNAIRGMQKASANRSGKTDKAQEAYGSGLEAYIKSGLADPDNEMTAGELAEEYNTGEGNQLYGKFVASKGKEEMGYATGGSKATQAKARIAASNIDFNEGKTPEELEALAQATKAKGAGTISAKDEASLANDQITQLANVATYLEQLTTAMEDNIKLLPQNKVALDNNTAVITALTVVMDSKATDAMKNKAMENATRILTGVPRTEQPVSKPGTSTSGGAGGDW
jgi:hypothetical protein